MPGQGRKGRRVIFRLGLIAGAVVLIASTGTTAIEVREFMADTAVWAWGTIVGPLAEWAIEALK